MKVLKEGQSKHISLISNQPSKLLPTRTALLNLPLIIAHHLLFHHRQPWFFNGLRVALLDSSHPDQALQAVIEFIGLCGGARFVKVPEV